MEILHRDDLERDGFAGLREHHLVIDTKLFGANSLLLFIRRANLSLKADPVPSGFVGFVSGLVEAPDGLAMPLTPTLFEFSGL